MEKEKVVHVTRKVIAYLSDLVDTLYEDDYFSYKENAQEYVNNIIDDIYKYVPNPIHHRDTPKELKKRGENYVKIKGSKRTTWYVLFNQSGNRYVVKFVTNNHSPEANNFNRL